MKKTSVCNEVGGRLLLALLLTVMQFATAYAAEPPQAVVVTAVKGDVRVTMRGQARAVQAGTVVELPASVVTGANGALDLRQDVTTVSIAADTGVEIPAVAASTPIERVLQSRGNVFYSVGKRETRKLRVETPYLVAVIKGTQFNVAVQGDGATVSLFEGRLEVRAPDGSDVVDLNAGEMAIRQQSDKTIRVIKMSSGEAVRARAQDTQVAGRTPPPNSHSDNGSQPTRDGSAGTGSGATPGSGNDNRGGGNGGQPGGNGGGRVVVSGGNSQLNGSAQLDVVAANATLDLSNGALKPAVDVGVAVGSETSSVGVGVSVGVDAGSGVSADVGVSTGVDIGAGTVDVSADVGVDVGLAGTGASVDVGADVGVDLGSGSVDLGGDASVGLGGTPVADVGVDLGAGDIAVDAGVDIGTPVADVGADLGLDAGAGGLDVDLGADVGTPVADAGIDVGAGTGGIDLGLDLDVGGTDLGLDLGLGGDGGLDLGLDLGGGGDTAPAAAPLPPAPEPPSDGGLLGGLIGRLRGGR